MQPIATHCNSSFLFHSIELHLSVPCGFLLIGYPSFWRNSNNDKREK
jgi:hypothetical protein